MYFSLITPTPGKEREAAFEWTKNPYEQHQWLWQFLPAKAGSKRDFLFRRRDCESKFPGFYVLSQREPISNFASWQVQVKPFSPQLLQGLNLAFDLRANPVVTHKVNGKRRRDDVVMHKKRQLMLEHGIESWPKWDDLDVNKPSIYKIIESECSQWLQDRSDGCGFTLKAGESGNFLQVESYLQHRVNRKDITFSSVDFSGVLEITNVGLFQNALTNGIGKSKAFGCGLMLIRKI